MPASEFCKQLRALGSDLAGTTPTETSEARAQYTLHRWVDIWESTAAWERTTPADSPPKKTALRMRKCLDQVESLLSRKADGSGWGEYFKLDALHQATAEGVGEPEHRAIARKVLDRMVSTRLTMSQMKFANEGSMAALKTQLHSSGHRAGDRGPAARAPRGVRTDRPSEYCAGGGQRYPGYQLGLTGGGRKISERLDTHYRNANLRIAATAALLNRLVPQPERMDAPVSDTVLNVPVYGNSSTMTKLTVQLIPDQQRIRLALVAKGLVDSNTVATSGPATFRSQGKSTFVVRKLIVIGPYGLSVWPAVAEADNSYNYLQSLETDYDGMPLVGSFMATGPFAASGVAVASPQRSRIQGRHAGSRAARARSAAAVDESGREHREEGTGLTRSSRHGGDADRLFDDRGPRRRPHAPLDARTTRRPHPASAGASDSWYSVQLHESAINNGIEQLGLNGRAFELPDLFVWVGKKVDRPQMGKLDDLPEDVKMTFAKQDAVRVRCEGGRMEVILSFAELTQGRNRWHDFTVRTNYKPDRARTKPCSSAMTQSTSKAAASKASRRFCCARSSARSSRSIGPSPCWAKRSPPTRD